MRGAADGQARGGTAAARGLILTRIMLPRFHLTDILTLAHYVGSLLVLVGALMFIPLVAGLACGEHAQVVNFLAGAGFSLLVGSLLRMVPTSGLDRRRALLLTGIAWVFVALVAALPMYLSGDFASFLDALFDAVSSITTTGASLAADVDALSHAQIVWRACLAMVGAQAIVIVTLFFGLGFADDDEGGALNERGVRNATRSNLRSLARDVVCLSLATLAVGGTAASIALARLGLPALDAAVEGFSLAAHALSTSAFIPHVSNLLYYHSLGLDALAAVLMLLGSLNFTVFICCMRGRAKRVRRNAELRTYAVWMVLVVLAVSVALVRDGAFPSAEALASQATFMSVSAATTGGMQTVYPEQFGGMLSDGALILLMCAVIFGGCTASASGGVKVFRVMQILRWFRYSVLRQLVPDSAWLTIRYEHFGSKRLTPAAATSAMTAAIFFIVFAALGAMLFIAHGNDAVLSVCESLGFLCNTGFDVGLTSPSMPLVEKIVAMLQMWAGRLEFIALFAIVAGLIVSFRPMRSTRMLGPHGKSARRVKGVRCAGASRKARGAQGAQSAEGTRGAQGANASRVFGKARGAGHGERGGRVLGACAALLVCACLMGQGAGALSASAAGAAQAATTSDAGASTASAASAPSSTDAASAGDNPADGALAAANYRDEDVKSLLGASYRLDGKTVRFTGVATGAALAADDGHVWICVKSAGRSIGVLVDAEQAAQVTHFTDYTNEGDDIVVEGTFNRACAEHAGELEVHAENISVEAQGGPVERPVPGVRLVVAVVLALLALVATIACQVVLRRTGRSGWLRRALRSRRARQAAARLSFPSPAAFPGSAANTAFAADTAPTTTAETAPAGTTTAARATIPPTNGRGAHLLHPPMRGEGTHMGKSRAKEQKNHPVLGLLVLLAAAVAFIAFLVALTVLVWAVM